jgi:hypothetical protein
MSRITDLIGGVDLHPASWRDPDRVRFAHHPERIPESGDARFDRMADAHLDHMRVNNARMHTLIDTFPTTEHLR